MAQFSKTRLETHQTRRKRGPRCDIFLNIQIMIVYYNLYTYSGAQNAQLGALIKRKSKRRDAHFSQTNYSVACIDSI